MSFTLVITFASLSAILSFYVSPFTEKKIDFLTSSIGLEQKLKLINEGNLNDLGNGTYLFFNKLDGSTYKNILLIDDSEELSIIQADSLQFSFDEQNHFNFQNGSAIFFLIHHNQFNLTLIIYKLPLRERNY